MSEREPVRWAQVWVGAALVGVGVVGYFLGAAILFADLGDVQILAALGLLGIVALSAWLTYRNGERDIAIGIAGGYGVLALVSGGECTLFVTGDGMMALFGLVAYPAVLLAALIVGGISHLIRRNRKGGR